MKKLLTTLCILALEMVCIFALSTTAQAATSGSYTYSVSDEKATITDYKTSVIGDVTIPSTLGGYPVTIIGDYAFYDCDSLTSVTIPDSVTTIGNNAFYGCDSLTFVTIPDSVTIIGDVAFYDCDSLTSVTIGNGVTVIGDDTFSSCDSLTAVTIPDGVMSIGYSAFGYCNNLTDVYYNGTEAQWGDVTVHSGNEPLLNATFHFAAPEAPNAADYTYTVENGEATITGYTGNGGYITIPSTLGGYPVTAIGYGAFKGCTSLKNVTIPSGVTIIDIDAFNYCTSLTGIAIPDGVTDIGKGAFKYCINLEEITLPDSVNSIGEEAFYETKLYNRDYNWENNNLYIGNHLIKGENSANIKSGLITIADRAFEDTYLGPITIEASVENIGNYAFYNCRGLNNVIFEDSDSNEDCLNIGAYAFAGCDELSCVTFGKRSAYIGAYAFRACDSLRELTLGDSIVRIGAYAFSGCSRLTTLTIPDSVTSIWAGAFQNCSNLEMITLPFVGNTLNSEENVHFGYIFGAETSGYHSYAIPETLKKVVVTKATNIGTSAFSGCENIEIIQLPGSVVTIGDYAFANCSNLYNSTGLIPNGVTSIGYRAFKECKRLPSIKIPDSVMSIGKEAFSKCHNIRTVSIGKGVETIPTQAFFYCDALEYVEILPGVTKIEQYAFENCWDITSVSLPNTVTSIIGNAFHNCSSLTNVWFTGNRAEHYALAFLSGDHYLLAATWHYNTCPDEHTYTYYCDATCNNCEFIRSDVNNHRFDNACDSTCNNCEYVRIPDTHKVGYYTITNPSQYPFSYSGGVYNSSNNSDNSSATLTLNILADFMMEIDYYTSTEYRRDKLTITHNDTTKVVASGQMYWNELSFSVKAGDKVYIAYTKDGSGSGGDDTVGFKMRRLPGLREASAAEPTCAKPVVCVLCNKTVKNKLDHNYSSNCDSSCEVCGTTRTPPHTYSNACDPKCNNCEATRVITHNYVDATCTGPKSCKVCGATTGNALGHSYDAGKVTRAATCKTAGVKTYTCKTCGATQKSSIAKLTKHTYTNNCDTACNVCSAKRTIKHTYTNNCDTACNVCSAKRTIKHTYSNSCDKTCNVCKTKRTIKHTYSNSCDTTCNVCSAKRSIAHSYKTTTTKATLSKNGKIVKKCTVCGKVASTSTIKYVKTIKLSATSYTYNGKVKTPTVTVKDSAGKTLKKGTDYTVTYASGRKKVGTYKVTVKMIGNYSGSKTLTFKIKPIDISKCSVKLSATSYTYNGKVKTPTVVVKNASGTKLIKGTHYSVTYASGRKNVGTYKVTIKMKGNYTGTKVLTFKILPKAASISKLAGKSKAIAVTLNKVTTQSTGYQIQYSTSSKFTSAKTAAVGSYKTSIKGILGLKAKTGYYVRVRTYKTVGGKNYYSNWSAAKFVKTK